MTDEFLHLKGSAALVLALFACTAPQAPPRELAPAPTAAPAAPAPRPAPTDPATLVGTRWRLVEADGTAVAAAGGYNPVTVEFGSESFGGHSGCNAYGTGYEIAGRRFVTSAIEADAMGCTHPVGTLERRLFQVLGSPFDVAIEPDGRLAIVKDGTTALRFVRIAPAPPLAGRPEPAALVGSRWRLVEADGRRISGDPAFRLVTLDFGEGTISGHSGCNAYGTPYRLAGRRFLPAPVTATQRGCGPPVGTLERRLFEVLGRPFEVDADAEGRLVIVSGGAPALRFEPR